jgi:hypothetical protein
LKPFPNLDSGPRETVEFVKMVDKGAIYVGYNGRKLSEELARHPGYNIYVFPFNQNSRDDTEKWEKNEQLLLQLLKLERCSKSVAIVNSDTTIGIQQVSK